MTIIYLAEYICILNCDLTTSTVLYQALKLRSALVEEQNM